LVFVQGGAHGFEHLLVFADAEDLGGGDDDGVAADLAVQLAESSGVRSPRFMVSNQAS
jgi:hypothetical protein